MKEQPTRNDITTTETHTSNAVLRAGGRFLCAAALYASAHAVGAETSLIALEGMALPGTDGDPVAVLKPPFTNEMGDLFVGGTLLVGTDQDGFVWTEPDQVAFRGSDLPAGALVSSRGAASNSGDWMIRTFSEGTQQMRSGYGVVAQINDIVIGATAWQRIKDIAQPTLTGDGTGFFRAQLKNLATNDVRWAVLRAEDGGAAEVELEIDPDSDIDGYPLTGLGVTGFGTSDNGVHQVVAVDLDDQGMVRNSLVIGGQVVAMTDDSTGRPNEQWRSFDAPSVHADGSYVGSALVAVGASTNEVLAYAPSASIGSQPRVILAEGDCVGTTGGRWPCVTLEADGGFKTAAFDRPTPNETHAIAHVWVNSWSGPAAGAEYLSYACDANEPQSSHLLLEAGAGLDLDGDGTQDALVDRVGIPGYPDIAFDDSQLYIGADLVIGGQLHYAILGLDKPDCGGATKH